MNDRHPRPARQATQGRGLLVALLALTLAGCSGLPVNKETDNRAPEDVVKERSQARLDALLAGDIAKAWTYTTPSYRERADHRAYTALVAGSVNWTRASVDSVSCAEEACDVTTMISYKLRKPRIENTRPLEERWIKVDGQWWIFHRGR